MKKKSHTSLWNKHGRALRRAHELFAGSFTTSGITNATLSFAAETTFVHLLKKFGITLLASREYENLLIALSPSGDTITQTFFHLPHPSGIAVTDSRVYVAATRNPNQIIEFLPTKKGFSRPKANTASAKLLTPARTTHFAGCHYLHDLAFIGDDLYANAVGMNAVVQVDLLSSSLKPVWWPRCIGIKKPSTAVNHVQLNSIAAGATLATSFFSASGDSILDRKPGDPLYPVNRRGVVFSGTTREPVSRGLTRPHSARLYKGRIIVANSGYGQIGFADPEFSPQITLPGWTRGLHIVGDVLFAGVSRVLPRFSRYAPGIQSRDAHCAIYAISLPDWKVRGRVVFPAGNQIFAIESISMKKATGFPFTTVSDVGTEDFFLTYRV